VRVKPALKWLWADKVWKSNRQLFQDGLDVQQYLFEDRIPLAQIRPALIQRFGPKCFYCNATTPEVTRFHVDHVLPLSVTKMNGLANLVLACPPCNSSKSDHLPILEHVERALGMLTPDEAPSRDEATLDDIGDAIGWDASWFVNHKLPRWAATTLVFVIFLALLGAFVGAAIPPLVQQAGELIHQAPHYIQQAQDLLVPKIIGRAVKVPALITVVAVLIGGALLGIVGALVAIPIAAALQLLTQEILFPRLDNV
jgi:hypothetical protein